MGVMEWIKNNESSLKTQEYYIASRDHESGTDHFTVTCFSKIFIRRGKFSTNLEI